MGLIWRKTKEFLHSLDVVLVLTCLACSAISMTALYSLWETGQLRNQKIMMQAIGIGLGLLVALVVSVFDYEILARLWKLHLPAAVALVLLTWTPLGIEPTGGLADDRAWLNLGFFTLQPSEILKLSFILTFALHLSKVGEDINHLKPFLLLCLHGAGPCLLIMAQGDFGTALIFLAIFVVMMFVAGLSAKWIVVGLVGAAAAAPVVWFFVLPDYLKERFYVAQHPEIDRLNKGLQQYTGRLAFGSGGLYGRGIANPDLYNKVPVVSDDFIFSYIGQILGFVGSLATLLLIAVLCVKILMVARMSRDMLGAFICTGVFAMFLVQTIINLGMVLCITPVIGVTLPFFSSGGTSVVVSYAAIGLVLSVYRQNKKDLMFD